MKTTVDTKMNEYNRIMNDIIKDKLLDLSKVMNEKDNYTFCHCQRVLDYCFLIGYDFNLSREEIEDLAVAAYLHDIGKIAMPDNILKKPDILTEEEMIVIKVHPRISAGVLRAAGGSTESVKAAACHHERYDGNGYPYGFPGENIPFLSRIIAVADAYDAMTSNRHYAAELEQKEALLRLKACSGTQFDSEIVSVFTSRMTESTKLLQEAV